jgi:hypothetical protein
VSRFFGILGRLAGDRQPGRPQCPFLVATLFTGPETAIALTSISYYRGVIKLESPRLVESGR